MAEEVESGDLGVPKFNVHSFIYKGGGKGLEDLTFEEGFDGSVGTEGEEVMRMGTLGFGKFLGRVGVGMGVHGGLEELGQVLGWLEVTWLCW